MKQDFHWQSKSNPMLNFEKVEAIIDFYGGTHGNFLEYIINRYIFSIECCKDFTPFNNLGTAHAKNDNDAYIKDRKIVCRHFSAFGDKMSEDIPIIKIKVSKYYHPVAVYNAVLRAGDQFFDINELEKNTLAKLPIKHEGLKAEIIRQLGNHINYNRKDIRNFFFSKLMHDEYSISLMNHDIHPENKSLEIDVAVLFEFQKFTMMLGDIANFLNCRFAFDKTLYPLWLEFMSKNHGYNSFTKCSKIIDNIIQCQDYEFKVNVLEEAYINFFIVKSFGVYENLSCYENQYPTNTRHILDEILAEKERLRWT